MKDIEWTKISDSFYELDFILYEGLILRCHKHEFRWTTQYDICIVRNDVIVLKTTWTAIERDMFDGISFYEMRRNDEIFWDDMLKPFIGKIKESLLEIEKTFEAEE